MFSVVGIARIDPLQGGIDEAVLVLGRPLGRRVVGRIVTLGDADGGHHGQEEATNSNPRCTVQIHAKRLKRAARRPLRRTSSGSLKRRFAPSTWETAWSLG